MNKELQFPTLRVSPLVETVLSVFVKADELDDEHARKIVHDACPCFRYMEPIVDSSLNIDLTKADKNIEPRIIWRGARFRCEQDCRFTLIVRNLPAGTVEVALSMLKPYSEWNDFGNIAQPSILSVLRVMNASALRRIGLRNVNRMYAPRERCAMTELIRTFPPSPQGLEDGEMREFFLRETRYDGGTGLYATVVRMTQPPTQDGRVPIVFDTDVFRPLDGLLSEAELSRLLADMRYFKNMLFFGTVGERLMEAFR